MDKIECMTTFVRVVETGSFSAVAREMGTTQPTISKQIAALEEYLDIQLLVRSTRSLRLTDEGERFYEHCRQVMEAVTAAEASVGKRVKPSGLLRVNCPVSFGHFIIMPLMKSFLTRYPEIKVDLTMSDQFIDLVETGVDVAIRIGDVLDTALISKIIGITRRITVATNDYFQQAGEPQTPSDLIHHNCIVYTQLLTGNEWHFKRQTETIKVRVNGNFQANNSTAIREAVLAGIGIAISPVWLFGDVINTDKLKSILLDYEPTPLPIYAMYRRTRFTPVKVQCFIDFLKTEFQINPWVSDYGH
jgi:DNA-binding transcriptional LysR family regulator